MITRNKHIDSKWKLVSVIICVVILDLLSLYYIKYKNQGLPLSDINLLYTGNLLNLIFSVLLIVGIIFYSFSKNNVYNPKLLILFTVLMAISLLFAEFYALP